MIFEQEVVENKRLRQEIDAKIQEVKDLPASRERSLTITKLQEAVMWLGMDLNRLGTDNPYPPSKDPSTGTEQEVVENKRLRQEIDAKIQEVKDLPASRERSLTITKLQEAVMWLGMDLKRLGTDNPYPSSKDPSTGTVIEPTADGLKL